MKEVLKVPIYIRYMDDMLLIVDDKDKLKFIYERLKEYAEKQLELRLKPPIFRATKDGQNFLGYKVKPYRCELSGRSKRRYRKKLQLYGKLFDAQLWDEQTFHEHLLPLVAFVKHAESWNFRKACLI